MIEPSHNDQAEQALLGCLMLDPSLVARASAVVPREAWYRDRHRAVYDAIVACGDRAGIVTVTARLRETGKLDDVGASFVAGLPDLPQATEQWDAYADLVCKDWVRRRIIAVATDVLRRVATDDPAEIVADTRTAFRDALVRPSASAVATASEVLRHVWQERDRVAEIPTGEVPGVPYGLPRIDDATGGQLPGQVTVIVAPTGAGKSVLTGQCWQAAGRRGPALLCSNEMAATEYVQRVLARRARVPLRSVRDPRRESVEDTYRLSRVAGEVDDDRRLYLADGVYRISAMEAAMDVVREQAGSLAWVGLDWVQLMSGARGRRDSRVQELDDLMTEIKTLAHEYQVPIVVVTQMDKASVSGGHLGPESARGSGMIAQVAHVVLAIREDPDTRHQETRPAEIVVVKCRNGARVTEPVQFRGPFCEFVPLETRREVEEEER